MDRSTIEELVRSQNRTFSPRSKIYEDTTEFMDLQAGDVMLIGGVPLLITKNEKEVGFGMDDDQKYWVKRILDLTSGEVKIVKLVFYEKFTQKIGDTPVVFFRSPAKEAKVLEVVTGHRHFMQGTSTEDVAGNNVRIIDFIRGPSLNLQVSREDMPHEEYCKNMMPQVLAGLCDCLESLNVLHVNGLVHGDVRWDHILWDRDLETYRWIDFDYNYDFPENPWGADLFGIGKILSYVVGKGPHLYSDIIQNPAHANVAESLVQEDFSILETGKLMNLKKLYPCIPEELNNILLHFSGHAQFFYESIHEILDDVRSVLNKL